MKVKDLAWNDIKIDYPSFCNDMISCGCSVKATFFVITDIGKDKYNININFKFCYDPKYYSAEYNGFVVSISGDVVSETVINIACWNISYNRIFENYNRIFENDGMYFGFIERNKETKCVVLEIKNKLNEMYSIITKQLYFCFKKKLEEWELKTNGL